MLDIERQEKIMSIISEHKVITTKELERLVYVSSSTIIRDLKKMEKLGLVKRTHGGAAIIESKENESSLTIRVNTNIKEKRLIAETAASFINNNDVIFMDSSSTVQSLIPFIKSFNALTIITNGLNNALLLSNETSATVYIVGGNISQKSNSAVGSDAVQYINKFNADLALFSASGIANNNISEHAVEQANFKKEMIKRAKIKILLCDSSKFNKINLANFCKISDINFIITDTNPPKEIQDEINKTSCKLIIAK